MFNFDNAKIKETKTEKPRFDDLKNDETFVWDGFDAIWDGPNIKNTIKIMIKTSNTTCKNLCTGVNSTLSSSGSKFDKVRRVEVIVKEIRLLD